MGDSIESVSVWPDLAKFCHLGKILKSFGNYLSNCLVFVKIVNLVFLLAWPSQDVFLLPHIPNEGKGVVSILLVHYSMILLKPAILIIMAVVRYKLPNFATTFCYNRSTIRSLFCISQEVSFSTTAGCLNCRIEKSFLCTF